MSTARFTKLEPLELATVLMKWVLLFLMGHFVKLFVIMGVKNRLCESNSLNSVCTIELSNQSQIL